MKKKRLNLDLSPSQYCKLVKLSKSTGYTMSEILIHSLRIYGIVFYELNGGGQLCIVDGNGNKTKVVVILG